MKVFSVIQGHNVTRKIKQAYHRFRRLNKTSSPPKEKRWKYFFNKPSDIVGGLKSANAHCNCRIACRKRRYHSF